MTSQEGPTPSQEGRPDPWAAVVAIADELERSASALRRAMHYVPVLCHCGDPAAHTAGDDDGRMDDYCERCTSVRCDAYPGSCAPLYPAGSVAAVIRAHQWLGTSSSGHSQCSCNPDVWVDDYADHVAAALAAVVVSSPATPAEDADPFVADRHRLAGYLDACLDGLGHTDVHSSTWLEEFEADFPAPPPASPAETREGREPAGLLAAVSAWIDAGQGDRDPEAVLWGRVAKITEEAGEAIAALIGATGQNPRKGWTHTFEDVQSELLDVALTALAAVEHLNENNGSSLGLLTDKIVSVARRAGVLAASPAAVPLLSAAIQPYMWMTDYRCDYCEGPQLLAAVLDALASPAAARGSSKPCNLHGYRYCGDDRCQSSSPATPNGQEELDDGQIEAIVGDHPGIFQAVLDRSQRSRQVALDGLADDRVTGWGTYWLRMVVAVIEGRDWPIAGESPARSPASPAETAHDPHAALAPELVGLLEDWDTNSEDDNYSKGQAADDLRAALTRACGCERGHLPHDRRCPTRLARSASPAETREGREAAEERAERWKRAIYSIDAPLTNCMALADAEIAAARADVAAEVKRAAERAGLDDQGNSGRVAFLILMDVAAALAASPAAVPLPDESWGGRMLAACDETCEATSLHHHTRTPDGRYWSKFGPAPAGLPTEPPSLPGEQPGGQQ